MSIEAFQHRIRAAAEAARPLRLRGGGSKDFYGNEPAGEVLDTRAYAGIVAYEPTELVVTARCGTPLSELERVLAAEKQCLPFEPPHFGEATVGGCVAAGLSGPRRASAGAVRDFVLGARVVDGRGQDLRFGGQVMKNVAGYDVSRLLAGSLGTLGVIVEVSLKVLPVVPCEETLRLEMGERAALDAMNAWGGRPLPVSATAWHAGALHVRFSGAAPAVRAAAAEIGGERVADGAAFWDAIREHRHAFFTQPGALWRLAVPSGAPPLGLAGDVLVEWGGGLRWSKCDADAASIREAARAAGGHAVLFRGGNRAAGVFAPLDPASRRLHGELKKAFDPAGILNPGRLVPGL